MDRILELRARRAGILEQMEAIVAAADADAGLSDEAQAQFDTLKAEDDRVAAQLATLEDLERRRAAAATPVAPIPVPGAPAAPAASVPAQVAEPGLRFARMTRTIAAAGGIPHVAQQIAEANGDSGLFANQNMSNGPSGGFLVPEDVSSEIIELLRPASTVRRMGARTVPMPNGNLTTNRRATGAMFGYIGEQEDVPATGYTYGKMKLSAKKLAGIVPISNDLLRASGTNVDRLIRDDIVADAAQIEDRFFLRGSGTENAPKGLRFQHTGTDFAATHVLQMTATPDLQKVDNDLGRLELALANFNVPYDGAHWIMAPRTAMFLTNLRDGNGNKVYPEMAQGQLRGKPVHTTTEIPINLGGGAESEIMLAHPQHVVIGEHMGIELAMSSEAAYRDSDGTMQAAFSRDETLMRMIMQHDLGVRHLPAVAILTGVTWAPGS